MSPAIHYYYAFLCCFWKRSLGNRRLLGRKKAAAANPTAEVSDFFLGGASVTPNGQLPSVRLPLTKKKKQSYAAKTHSTENFLFQPKTNSGSLTHLQPPFKTSVPPIRIPPSYPGYLKYKEEHRYRWIKPTFNAVILTTGYDKANSTFLKREHSGFTSFHTHTHKKLRPNQHFELIHLHHFKRKICNQHSQEPL